jgi:hypothetical protein
MEVHMAMDAEAIELDDGFRILDADVLSGVIDSDGLVIVRLREGKHLPDGVRAFVLGDVE